MNDDIRRIQEVMEREAGWEASLAAGDSIAKTFGLTATLTAMVAAPARPHRPQRK